MSERKISTEEISRIHAEANEINREVDNVKKLTPSKSYQEAADGAVLRARQRERVQKEYTPIEAKNLRPVHEYDPEQSSDPEEYTDFLRERDTRILEQARQKLAGKNFSSQEEYAAALEKEIHDIKYFPVLLISVPHVPEGVTGTFPGLPTPLLYATSVLDRYLRSDTFPAQTSPEITGILNPLEFSDNFVAELIARVQSEKPRVVGLSATTEGFHFAKKIAHLIRQHSPETMILLGGAHADGVNLEAYLRAQNDGKIRPELSPAQIGKISADGVLQPGEEENDFDMVFAGDAPYALKELFQIVANHRDWDNAQLIKFLVENKNYFENVNGCGDFKVRSATGQIENLPLSQRPLDWNKLPTLFHGRLVEAARNPLFPKEGEPGGKKTLQMMTKMGCQFSCFFCMESMANSLYKVSQGDRPTVERVLQDLELYIRDYGYEAVFFDDSTFTQFNRTQTTAGESVDRHHDTHQLLDGIIAMGQKDEKLKFEWACQTAFKTVTDEALIKKMKDAGCTYIYFGFEQLETSIAGNKNKTEINQVRQVLQWCRKHEIRAGISLQFGLDAAAGEVVESEAQFKETIQSVADLHRAGLISDGAIAININTPYPGTKQYADWEANQTYDQELSRHMRFESAHQLSSLNIERVNKIYDFAHRELGHGLLGVNFTNQEISDRLDLYKNKFENDFYLDGERYGEYLSGQLTGLHLNHASISNRPHEKEDITRAYDRLDREGKSQIFDTARARAAALLGADPRGVIFGRNTTEVVAVIARMMGIKTGDVALMSTAENDSIKRAFEINMDHGNPTGEDRWSAYPTMYHERGAKYLPPVEDLTGARAEVVEVINLGQEQITENIKNAIKPETKFLVMSHVIRDTGQELPVRALIDLARRQKRAVSPQSPDLFVIVDGAQALGNVPQVNFEDIGCDAYVATPHKTMTSTPVGLGFVRPELIAANKNRLNKLFWQDEQVILENMFDPSCGVKANVNDTIESKDVLGFNLAIDHLRQQGLVNGDFGAICEKRRAVKQYFRDQMNDWARSLGLPLFEVKDGTDFIYSFSLGGINNRAVVEALSQRGIFVSYIDRTKLQTDVPPREGDGVIRVSFGVDNTVSEVEQFTDVIRDVVTGVARAEQNEFTDQADKVVVFTPPTRAAENVVSLTEWLKAKQKSVVRGVAVAAGALLMALSHKVLDQAPEVSLDAGFAADSIAQLEHWQKEYGRYQALLERDGFQHRLIESAGDAQTMVEKYAFLTNLNNAEFLDKALGDQASQQVVAGLDYTPAEKEQIKKIAEQTHDKNLSDVVGWMEKFGRS